MQLTQYTDYSLRVMAYLAKTEGVSTIAGIAEYFGVSRNHLVKVVHNLSKNGFIRSTRGKGGGIQLARPAESISLGDIVRVTEPNFNLVECFTPAKGRCIVAKLCGLKLPLYEAQRAFMSVLDRSTLANAARDTEWLPMHFTARPDKQ
ncbi:Rrf2 family transcriptional regulator [Herbaspirillum sp. HC18]|nr:Rrf2 family transcriptional regulator [Herbaspirillum sp. HC18]